MPLSLTDILTGAVLLWIGSRLVLAARRTFTSRAVRARSVLLVRGIRWRHVLPVPLVLGSIATASYLLIQVPGLDFGWWSALGGTGNPVVGSTEQTAGTPLEYLLPIVFLLLLLPSLPLFVEAEERAFRLGAETWPRWKQGVKALQFGLVHAIVGIPIGVAIALTIGGVWFTERYLWGVRRGGPHEGLLESTRAHLAYNGLILTLVLATFAWMGVMALLG